MEDVKAKMEQTDGFEFHVIGGGKKKFDLMSDSESNANMNKYGDSDADLNMNQRPSEKKNNNLFGDDEFDFTGIQIDDDANEDGQPQNL